MCFRWFVSASLAIILASSIPSSAQSPSDSCEQVDIVFVLDSSGSIGADHWPQVLSFVKYIVNQFNVGPYAVQFGVVSFGNEATINFQLNTYNNTQSILNAVDKIPWKDENTNTSGALYMMRTVMFTRQNGDRPQAPNVCIVVTDGQSTYDHNLTLPYANEAKQAGITMIAIGVGNQVDMTELNGIASPSKNGTPIVFTVDNYDVLSTIQGQIADVACDPPVACTNNADIVFLLDSSANIGPTLFGQFKSLIKSLIDEINVADGQSNIAVVTYSDNATIRFDLSRLHTRLDLKNAIDNITYAPSSKSNLADALRLAREQVFVASRGDRANLPNIAVVLTNRASSNATASSEQAKLARLAGIGIMAAAVKGWLSMNELYDIASSPAEYNVIVVDSGDQLSAGPLRGIKLTICDRGFTSCSSKPCGNNGVCQATLNGYYCQCPGGYAGPGCQQVCQPADVVLVLDRTTLISPDDFYQQVVPFARTFASTLNIQAGQTQFGLETFANSSKAEFYLNTYTNPTDVVGGINPAFTGGKRNTSGALDMLTDEMFSTGRGARTNVNRVAVIVTYGVSLNTTQAIASAVRAKDRSITLIVVAVGISDSSVKLELSGIASDPSSLNVIYVDQLANLSSIIGTLTTSVCNSINECSTGPCTNGGTCVDTVNSYNCQCPPNRNGQNCEQACSGKMDITILLDSSGSIRETRFPILLNFTISIINALNIGPNTTRVALVSFSDTAKVEWYLNTYQRRGDVANAIQRLQYIAGRTNTADALRKMTSQVFAGTNGDRPDVPNYCLIITDGVSTVNMNDTLPAAIDAKNSGTYIMAATIMPEGPTLELMGEVSDPYEYNLFSVQSYNDLLAIQSRFVTNLCNDINECSSNPCQNGGMCSNQLGRYSCTCSDSNTGVNCERVCTKSADVVFILDGSGSIQNAFDDSMRLTRMVIQGLNFANGRSRVGVMTFSDNATIAFNLNRYMDKTSILNAISFFQASGRTNTPAALDLLRTTMFTSPNGDRSDVPNYAVVLTDGFSNVNAQDTIPKAKLDQQNGITMMGVGMQDSDGVNVTEVQGISSTPPSRYSFLLTNYTRTDLQRTANSILDIICQ